MLGEQFVHRPRVGAGMLLALAQDHDLVEQLDLGLGEGPGLDLPVVGRQEARRPRDLRAGMM